MGVDMDAVKFRRFAASIGQPAVVNGSADGTHHTNSCLRLTSASNFLHIHNGWSRS